MERIFTILERLVPEAKEMLEIRYQIIRQIKHKAPVGRRQIAKDLDCTERVIRREIDMLKARGAVNILPAGIILTPYGEELLREIDEVMPFLFNTQYLAKQIKNCFGLEEVIIVPGDSFADYVTKKDLGRVAARYLQKVLYPGAVIAVTGGTTLAEMSEAVGSDVLYPDILVVPARGGLGEEMELQAGTIAAKIAKAIGAQYRLLHIPDNLEENTAEILKEDVHIKDVVARIKACDILIHGIGSAMEMAARRGLTLEEINRLEEKRAVGEALRYYLDGDGNIVYAVPGIGLELGDLLHIKKVIAVAGGRNKAEAIAAVLRHGGPKVLITDEGAASKIVSMMKGRDV
ncbi:central glycolytic genes regulator [Thermosyntropha lipolytica DSM 11003]|uniref:Central glycolytic genes regulator n=1 Tax=Thermosyntropha lipolytica DSM 11003 TaxID=1123382 RepID=A0A1M5MG69_9FIRM|nr:sugar-binding domain-containing protein [Thermosyntropha lipolytica]SHG76132.1 central glycolytic genes regulator [Thermosyntropha lipolytica DSM 11003]